MTWNVSNVMLNPDTATINVHFVLLDILFNVFLHVTTSDQLSVISYHKGAGLYKTAP